MVIVIVGHKETEDKIIIASLKAFWQVITDFGVALKRKKKHTLFSVTVF